MKNHIRACDIVPGDMINTCNNNLAVVIAVERVGLK